MKKVSERKTLENQTNQSNFCKTKQFIKNPLQSIQQCWTSTKRTKKLFSQTKIQFDEEIVSKNYERGSHFYPGSPKSL